MEQWHQKLHNNTSPDDVIICEALLAYVDAGLDTGAYWSTLQVGAARFQNPDVVPEMRVMPFAGLQGAARLHVPQPGHRRALDGLSEGDR